MGTVHDCLYFMISVRIMITVSLLEVMLWLIFSVVLFRRGNNTPIIGLARVLLGGICRWWWASEGNLHAIGWRGGKLSIITDIIIYSPLKFAICYYINNSTLIKLFLVFESKECYWSKDTYEKLKREIGMMNERGRTAIDTNWINQWESKFYFK